MIVVSDTTPINHLLLADAIFLLPLMVRRVLIPRAVFDELTASRTPLVVKSLISQPPDWIEVRDVDHVFDADLDNLGPGERQAILLAEETDAELLLMDELAGREIAKSRGLRVTGTLGLIERAAEKGLVDFPTILDRLKSSGFFISQELERDFLERDRARKNTGPF